MPYPEAVSMFDSLVQYAAGPAFEPKFEISDDLWSRLASE